MSFWSQLIAAFRRRPAPRPTQPRTRSFRVSLEDGDGKALVGVVTVKAGIQTFHEPSVVGQVEFGDVPDCPTPVRVEATVAGYKARPFPESYGPDQVACGPDLYTARIVFDKIAVPTPPIKPLPPPPTRDQILSLKLDFQGFDCVIDGVTKIVWEPLIADMTPAQRKQVYAQKHAQGDTHINLSLDLRGLASLEQRLDVVEEAAREGFWTLLMLMGDGNGRPEEQNHDPGALGWYWLMEHFKAIHDRLEARGLSRYVVKCPGYDGVVPGWQPFTRVNEWIRKARSIDPHGYHALEMSAGYGHSWTGENDDFATPDGMLFDLVLWEGPIDMGPPDDKAQDDFCNQPDDIRARWDQVWQTSKRLLGPNWIRPVDMPACDDPGIYHGGPSTVITARGPMFVAAFEFDTYERVRLGRLTKADVERHRQYLRLLGYDHVC